MYIMYVSNELIDQSEESNGVSGDRNRATYVTMVLAEYAKRMVLFEAEGYRPLTIAKMLESKGISVSIDGEWQSFYYE